MKFRTDFVTNSSSSSFICDICGDIIEDGYDWNECERGHIFCEDVIDISLEAIKEECKKVDTEKEYSWEINFNFPDNKKDALELYKKINGLYQIPEKACPICSFNEISLKDLETYIYKVLLKSNKESIIKEIKNKYNSYEEFYADLKK